MNIYNQNILVENLETSAIFVVIAQVAYYILFKLMEENHIEGLHNTLSVIKLQEQTAQILENVNSGVITIDKSS